MVSPRPTQPTGVQHLDLGPRRGGDRLRWVNREIEDTSRASPARSTLSARPKLGQRRRNRGHTAEPQMLQLVPQR